MNRDEFITNLILLGFVEGNGLKPHIYVLGYTHVRKMLHVKIDKQHNTVNLWNVATLKCIGPMKSNGLSNNYQEALKKLISFMNK